MPSIRNHGGIFGVHYLRLIRLLAVALVLAAILGPAGPGVAQDGPIVIRFSHVVDKQTPKGIGAGLFKQRVEARLPGRIRVEVYPQARRYTDEEVLAATALGDVEMAAPSFTQFRSFSRSMQVFELPFLFRDIDHLHRFQESTAGRQLLDSMLPQGIMGLAYWDSGMRVISANKSLRAPADAKGLLFRTEPSVVFQAQYQRIGVPTLPLPFRAVPDAIRQGLIHGQENSWSNVYSRGIHTLHRSFTELDHSFLGYMVVTNADFWTRLPTGVRTALEAVLAEVTAEVNRIAREQAQADRQKAKAEGKIEILTPTPEQLDAWREAFTPVWQEFEPQIGKEIIDAALAAQE